MANKPQTAVFRGKAQYAKVLGEPMLNYNKDGKEWKLDLVLADKGLLAEANLLLEQAGSLDPVVVPKKVIAKSSPKASVDVTASTKRPGRPKKTVSVS